MKSYNSNNLLLVSAINLIFMRRIDLLQNWPGIGEILGEGRDKLFPVTM